MDIFDRIKEDHDRYRNLFEKAKAAAEDDAPRSLDIFRELDRELRAHHETEEHTVFPALEQKEKTRELTEELFEEHESIDLFLGHVRDGDRSVRWQAKLGVLEELTTHHLDEEEKELFPKGREALLEEELKGLVTQFESRKREELEKLS